MSSSFGCGYAALCIGHHGPCRADRFALKAPNGVAFSEFGGSETWQDVALRETEDGIRAILGNPVMINA